MADEKITARIGANNIDSAYIARELGLDPIMHPYDITSGGRKLYNTGCPVSLQRKIGETAVTLSARDAAGAMVRYDLDTVCGSFRRVFEPRGKGYVFCTIGRENPDGTLTLLHQRQNRKTRQIVTLPTFGQMRETALKHRNEVKKLLAHGGYLAKMKLK